MNREELVKLYQHLDITSLNDTDNPEQIRTWVKGWTDIWEKSNRELKPASICVYAPLVSDVMAALGDMKVPVAAVSGNFPSGKTSPELKAEETRYAVSLGAGEIDMVIDRGWAASGNWEKIRREVQAVKSACGAAILKVILETGQFKEADIIKNMALAALDGGADFLKTSTGKIPEGASEFAARILLDALNQTGRTNCGLKISGGVRTAEQAEMYRNLVLTLRGEEFYTPRLFRIGASGLAGALADKYFGV